MSAQRWVVLAALGLAGCGGGGGGGDAGAPSPPPTLALTDSNALDAAEVALRAIDDLATVTGRLTQAGDVLLASGEVALSSFCHTDANSVGSVSYADANGSGTFSAGDRLSLRQPACDGLSMDAQAEVTFLSEAGIAGRVTFDASRASPATRSRGSYTFAFQTSPHPAWTWTNASFDFERNGQIEHVTMASGRYAFESSSYELLLDGRVDSPRLGGSFAFGASPSLAGFAGSFPAGGALRLTAGASSAVLAPFEDARTGEYRVDATGGGFGSAKRFDWQALMPGTLFGRIPNNTPIITSFQLEPPNPTAADGITAVFAAEDPNGDPLHYELEWRYNGTLLNYPSNITMISPTGFYSRGDVIEVTLRARDQGSFTTARKIVTIANAAPVVEGAVTLSPASPDTTDDIAATASATDVDHDAVTYSYAWLRNGVAIPNETADVLPAAEHARGDAITALVTASDGQSSSRTEVTVTIGDAPPAVRAAAAPTTVPYGVPLTFDTDAFDPDGDDTNGLTFRLAYGPAGMAVDPATGVVSWQPTGPMFDKTLDVHWAVTLDAPIASPAVGTITVSDPARAYPLMRTGLAPSLWPAGLRIDDFDGDGDEEALILSARGLYELARDGAGGYRQAWMYPFAFRDREISNDVPDMTAFATGDVDGDGRHELFVSSEGLIARLDGVERRVVATAQLERYLECRDLEFGDLDADGGAEIVCLTKATPWVSSVIVLRASDLSLLWRSPEARFGASLAVGNVDDDAALEIVTAGGYVIDGRSFVTQWELTGSGSFDFGFGFDVHTADVDGDDIDEIVAAYDWTAPVRVYDARAKTLRWQVTDYADLGALSVADLDGDGTPEFVVGEGQSGPLSVYKVDGEGAQLAFEVPINEDVRGIAVGDLDHDGKPDILWSQGHGPTLQVADQAGAIAWDSGVLWYGPFFGGELAGGALEARAPLFASLRSVTGLEDATRLLRMNPQTGDLTASVAFGRNANRAAAMLVTDYDRDGTDEAVFTESLSYDSRLVAYDFFAAQSEWATPVNKTQYAYGIALARADLTGDGRDDVAMISASGIVEAYDIATDTLLWQSSPLGEGRSIAVGDLNGDGVAELVAATWHDLFVFERRGPAQYAEIAHLGTATWDQRAVVVADVDGDGRSEIILLATSWNGFAYVSHVSWLDETLASVHSFELPWSGSSLAIEPSTSSHKNLLIPTGYRFDGPSRIVALDARSGEVIWRSPLLGSEPWSNSLHTVDLPGAAGSQMTVATELAIYLTR